MYIIYQSLLELSDPPISPQVELAMALGRDSPCEETHQLKSNQNLPNDIKADRKARAALETAPRGKLKLDAKFDFVRVGQWDEFLHDWLKV